MRVPFIAVHIVKCVFIYVDTLENASNLLAK